MEEEIKEQKNFYKVLISGASGFIGTSLIKALERTKRYEIFYLVRREPLHSREIKWNPDQKTIDRESIVAVSPDIIINLSGENVMGLWTVDKKKKIEDSRITCTKLLVEVVESLEKKPKLFLNASGCTFYGTQVYHKTDESSPIGKGFFPDLVNRWESICEPLTSISVRVAYLRFGLVLDPNGSFLKMVYYPFYLGLGGVVGSGNQYIPWISMRDTIASIMFVIENNHISGPINITSPNAVTNYQFTKTMGSVLYRPTIFWIPEFFVKLVVGEEMASEMVLSSQNVFPK
eukprot:gene8255-10145_t